MPKMSDSPKLDTMVLWDTPASESPTEVRYGDLMVQDRKTVAYDPSLKRWVGGYPY